MNKMKIDLWRVFTPVLYGEAKILLYLRVWLSNYHIYLHLKTEKKDTIKKNLIIHYFSLIFFFIKVNIYIKCTFFGIILTFITTHTKASCQKLKKYIWHLYKIFVNSYFGHELIMNSWSNLSIWRFLNHPT